MNVNEYKLCEFCTISPTITDSIGVITEGSGDPIYLQIDAIPEDYFKDRQGQVVKITLHATGANGRWNITVISKPLNCATR